MNFENIINLVAIDPGEKSGCIALIQHPQTSRSPMVQEMVPAVELNNCLSGIMKDGPILVILEKVNLQNRDKDGKQYRVESLIKHSAQIETICKLLRIPLLRVAPVTWQGYLSLKSVKPETYHQRKKRFKMAASGFFPMVESTMQSGDALCILEFGRRLLISNPDKLNDFISK